MNLLDAITNYLNERGPSTEDEITTSVIDLDRIARHKVTEDLQRLKTAGRVSVTKQGIWEIVS